MSTRGKYDERKLEKAAAGSASTQRDTAIAKTEFYSKAKLKVFKTAEAQDPCCGL